MQPWPSPSIPQLPGKGLEPRIFDTAAAEIRPTSPGEIATLYVCGITPYDATHIGHAATYIAFDVLQRLWRDAGHQVRYVQNITDVDDPLLERAAATGEDWQELAARETQRFVDDMTELRVLAPDRWLGVVETVPTVVQAVQALVDSGAAYKVDDDVYFDVTADPRFGGVGNLSSDEMVELSAQRGGDPERAGKRNPIDAVLWRGQRPGEPAWPSPFGDGRPGWHIECVAIALAELGTPFDVQGGGRDLIFPHHEIGASQGQVIADVWPFARAYMHTGMVGYEGQKMSKSVGNLVFVSDLRASHDPMAIRLAILAHRYRDDWEWTEAELASAEARLARWRAAVSWPTGPGADTVLDDVRRCLADDLDTPGALAVIDRWAEEQRLRGGDDPGAPGVVSRLSDALLGVAL